ncbi:DUF1206 domain-containing protein [Rhizobium sp. SAFR-030]|uniref:DUF1206 domain-containing protein n=1 Tax=Rhizobium sp. SAFR-030 TaxID=3387277 RepID=UPI003F81243A
MAMTRQAAERSATERLEWLARAGYAARGLVYVMVAGLVLLGSVGGGSPDSKSALQLLLDQPFGRIWLGLVAVALIGFVLWRLMQAIANADNHPENAKGYVARAGMLVSAITYSGLAFYAVSHALQMGGGGSGDGSRSWTAWLMRQPFGPYLVGIVGLCILGAGLALIFKGIGRRYRRFLSLDAHLHPALDLACVFGLVAKGVVFLIVASFFLYAAFAVDPDQAGSTADALTWVRQLPFGAALYILLGLGLLSFGLYGFIEARYRRVQPPSLQQARQAMPI